MGEVLLEKRIGLGSGEDWASDPIRLAKDALVELDCVGSTRFYALLVTNDYYDTALRGLGGSFPFAFGDDRSAHLEKFRAEKTDYYRVVLRVGVWSSPGVVTVRLVSES
jgi:hypothetical protein